MKFSLKIFLAVFLVTLGLGTALIWASHSYVSEQTKEDYISRYSVFAKVMGDTLTQLDTNTEALMLNAVKVIAARDSQKGLLSTNELKAMRSELSVTHIFVTDKYGKFIRSTNEDPSLIPNTYTFCQDYRKLIDGSSQIEATPIIQPKPEPKPYKFLYVASQDRQRLLEVAVRVDFVAKTLSEAVRADSNLVAMSLYSPTGISFGRFTPNGFDFEKGQAKIPTNLPYVVDAGHAFKFFTKVTSSHPKCCQCDVSKTSINGEYYYVLESEISKKELNAVMATARNIFFGLALLNLLFSYFLSRFISRRLVKNVETAARNVRKIRESGDLKSRIAIDGKDEVAFLTQEFDRMLDSLEESQQKVINAEKDQAKVQMAKEIAHNIRSPIVAIEMMTPMMSRLPERLQKVLRDSVREIKTLSDRLSRQGEPGATALGEVVQFFDLVESIVHKKRLEYSKSLELKIDYIEGTRFEETFVKVDPVEFQAVVSNLINNAIESYPSKQGRIKITSFAGHSNCGVEIEDNGKGMPAELVKQVGVNACSFQKEGGRGVGLLHASRVVKAWSGYIDIKSDVTVGTCVRITLPIHRVRAVIDEAVPNEGWKDNVL
jgi:signal transduction histidine kinase